MRKQNKILLLFIVISFISYSQHLTLKDYVIEEGDTIFTLDIPMVEIIDFKNAKEEIKYKRDGEWFEKNGKDEDYEYAGTVESDSTMEEGEITPRGVDVGDPVMMG